MKRPGVEQVIAEHLLTAKVLEYLAPAGAPTVREDDLIWHSWPQMFGSTIGPWNGFGGAAMTLFQVTVAVDRGHQFVLVFVGSDLYAHGWTERADFWEQFRGSGLATRHLTEYGLTVLERPLP